MKFPENIQEIEKLEPDYLGFIFYERSPRNFSGEIPVLNENIKKTGVFVDASAEFILEKIQTHQLQAVQLHGSEPPELCSALQSQKVEVLKVFSVGENFNFQELKKYEGKVNLFLFDTKGKEKGGNGKLFDWEILKKYNSETPFLLSGGIGLEQTQKIKELREFFISEEKQHLFYGIDVNSRFESAPGFKKIADLKKLKKELQKLPLQGLKP